MCRPGGRYHHAVPLACRLGWLIAIAQRPVYHNENKDGAKAAAPEFFCAVAGNNGLEKIIHGARFWITL